MLRVYTVMSPQFYSALVDHNLAHPPTEWIWFYQGVWSPDEMEGDADGTGVDAFVTQTFNTMTDFIDRTVRVLHGDGYVRYLAQGESLYTAEASPWCVGWVMGTEWYPYTVNVTNHGVGSFLPLHRGVYVNATDDASTFENWIAIHMEYLIARDMDYGWQRPVAFTNWLTTDPITHIMEPRMPVSAEDWLSVNGLHARARMSRAPLAGRPRPAPPPPPPPRAELPWPLDRIGVRRGSGGGAGRAAHHMSLTPAHHAGYFVNFHAYPYYPDFLKYPLDEYNVSYAYADNLVIEDPFFLCLSQLRVRPALSAAIAGTSAGQVLTCPYDAPCVCPPLARPSSRACPSSSPRSGFPHRWARRIRATPTAGTAT